MKYVLSVEIFLALIHSFLFVMQYFLQDFRYFKFSTFLFVFMIGNICVGQTLHISQKVYKLPESEHVFKGGKPCVIMDDNTFLIADHTSESILKYNNDIFLAEFSFDSIPPEFVYQILEKYYPEANWINPDIVRKWQGDSFQFFDLFDVIYAENSVFTLFYFEGFFLESAGFVKNHGYKMVAEFDKNLVLQNIALIQYPDLQAAVYERSFPYPDIQGGYFIDGKNLIIKNGASEKDFSVTTTPALFKYKKMNSDLFVYENSLPIFPDTTFGIPDFDEYDMTRYNIINCNGNMFFSDGKNIIDANGEKIFSVQNGNAIILDFDCASYPLFTILYSIPDSTFSSWSFNIGLLNLETNHFEMQQINPNATHRFHSFSVKNKTILLLANAEDGIYVYEYFVE